MSEILVIDDDPREGLAALLGAEWKHPSTVTEQDVLDADLIVIDQFLREWSFDPDTPATMHPRGGLAVASVLRSQLELSRTPIVIFTAGLNDLGRSLPSAIRRPVLAAEFGVEWVAGRTDAGLPDQVHQLREAATALPVALNSETSIDHLANGWLGLARSEWSELALLDIQECHPSRTRSSTDEPGMVFLRWFTHQVLPYPSFLLDTNNSAVRLGLMPSTFEEILSGRSELSRLLRDAQYTGQMAEFCGRRFWRAGLDHILDGAPDWVEGETSTSQVLVRLHGSALNTLEGTWRVPLDGDLNQLAPAPLTSLTRILPDHWPTFADDAFALSDEIEDDDHLRAWKTQTQRTSQS